MRTLRLTDDQYAALLKRRKATPRPTGAPLANAGDGVVLRNIPTPPEVLEGVPLLVRNLENKVSKYSSRTCGGYQSVKEAKRAAELRLEQAAGYIRNLRDGQTSGGQVRYELIPAQPGYRACHYYADFQYEERQKDGSWLLRVEDVKGYKGGAAYAVFKIKAKLMLHVHKIRVRES